MTLLQVGLSLFLITSCSLQAKIIIMSNLVQEFDAKPGDLIKGVIKIRNEGPGITEVELLVEDLLYNYEGQFFYENTHPRSIKSFLTVPKFITLEPGQVGTVPFEIQVPDDESMKGTYWGIITIQEEPEKVRAESRGFNLVVQYSLQVILNFGGGKAEIEWIRAQVKDGVVMLDVENTGTLIVQPMAWMEVEGGGRFKGGKRRLYPGCSLRFNIPADEVPTGHHGVTAYMDGGGVWWKREYSLEF